MYVNVYRRQFIQCVSWACSGSGSYQRSTALGIASCSGSANSRLHEYMHTAPLGRRDGKHIKPGSVFSYKLRYIVGFGLVAMAITTNPEPTI